MTGERTNLSTLHSSQWLSWDAEGTTVPILGSQEPKQLPGDAGGYGSAEGQGLQTQKGVTKAYEAQWTWKSSVLNSVFLALHKS
jgi:hypothetical protein